MLVERRLSGLGEETRKMLELASIIGREFNLGLLAPLARRPVADITDALEEAYPGRDHRRRARVRRSASPSATPWCA